MDEQRHEEFCLGGVFGVLAIIHLFSSCTVVLITKLTIVFRCLDLFRLIHAWTPPASAIQQPQLLKSFEVVPPGGPSIGYGDKLQLVSAIHTSIDGLICLE